MKEREFKFYPEDFDERQAQVDHIDLRFDVYDEKTHAVSTAKMKALKNLETLELDAEDLEVQEVECDQQEIKWKHNKKTNKLTITFSTAIKKDQPVTISCKNIITPTANILEGLYFDWTPEGQPPTQITQCQQWGFRRLVPSLDEMTTKCTYTTIITAKKKYTNIITNGDQVKGPDDIGDDRVEVQYDNMITPMATYLFFLGVGTYETFSSPFTYPDGKTFQLELLVPPGQDTSRAEKALDILHNGIMWIHLFTGKNKTENAEGAKEIWKYVKKREKIRKAGKDTVEVDDTLKELYAGKHWGYKYTGTVYREIGMQNSNFGGMENVGNTTITANRIMPYKETTDGSFEYMTRVKTHEFYHNLNGSEVTGWSPFDIWLNEAVTVHIERENHAFNFGENYSRLSEVLSILEPTRGTLSMDEGAMSMPIQPDGFNMPDELITGITYIKAPEFVRMLQTLMTDKIFVKGLDLYHTRFKHSNAKSSQWIEAMEEASGKKFKTMAKQWLTQTHFPILDVKREKEKITLTQRENEWHFPFSYALFNKEGKKIKEELLWIQEKEVSIEHPKEIGFISLNRGFTFFGRVFDEPSREELLLQLKNDDDIIAKYFAWYRLFEEEIDKLVKDTTAKPDEQLVDLYFSFLDDKELMEEVGAQFLAVFEYVDDPDYQHHYQDLYDAKKKLLTAVAEKYKDEIGLLYDRYSSMEELKGNFVEVEAKKIKQRSVKNVCLSLLSKLDTPEIHEIIKDQFEKAEKATDKISAFRLYVNSTAGDKRDLIRTYQKEAEKNLVSWETFLYVIASNDSEEYLELIREVEKSDKFDITQSNDQRGLFVIFSSNRKKSLETKEGRDYLKKKIFQLAEINEYNTLHLIRILQSAGKVKEEHRSPLKKILEEIIEKLSEEKTPSIVNQTKRILKSI